MRNMSEWAEGMEDLDEVPLFAAYVPVLDDVRHPDDAVERCAEFVRHVRDEVAFRLVRDLGYIFRRLEFLFVGNLIRDVAKNHDRTLVSSLIVEDEVDLFLDGENPSVLLREEGTIFRDALGTPLGGKPWPPKVPSLRRKSSR